MFEQLLEELGRELRMSLKVDANHSCLLQTRGGFKVQIEFDSTQENVIIGSFLGELPPGKYRENVLEAGLKENNLPYPRAGTFAYSVKQNALVFFAKLPSKNLTGTDLATLLRPFIEKGAMWVLAIKRGEVPAVALARQAGVSGEGKDMSVFNLGR